MRAHDDESRRRSTLIIPIVDVLRQVSLRIVTMPIQSQGIITRGNVSVDVSAVATSAWSM
ncbi:hypothetical protein OG439_15975 [Amycolatopsis sp. NBC_01307]|uniref:hypothetical protein n=1 Tax=Amycolatopsis sp. NBC_01307 TaxID=2903561 RepID=UPI002E0F0902|nr:hypothetical protein OG439_15975 [Amycolatopsis sp. NBC_01307]